MPDRQPPAFRLSRRSTDSIDAAGTCGDQSRANTVVAQDCHHSVHSVALSYPARVDFDTRPAVVHCLLFLVQHNVLVADTCHSPTNFRLVVKMPGTFEKTPNVHKRSDTDIECAVARLAIADAG